MKKSSASSQRATRRRLSAGAITLTDTLKDELSQRGKPARKIDLSDLPEVSNWGDAVRGRFFRPIKKPVSLRIDADVLHWFRSQGEKYQTQINAALRDYMNAHRR